ncbi:MAG: EAL domain-containing protein [Parvibaculum sp.]|jgi:EAL domain-containing protein (putative c-di-GMP-specific phosphodiesterase class I)|uniref:EAL domain-containing protein n=1 Tax=Parvibaculum sp. TaxID=2024848 RepID=UPI00285052B9|nr:EAL domain-containing protein [Parvibaculum sp.]MDR3499291.1 EAL domain-containing protein [Parvibaculum sp.]
MYSSSFRLTNRDIDLALEARHLFLVFQPKIELGSGRTLGAEAYVRWNHPDYGLMPPGLFLSFFEQRGRSVDLTCFVVAAAADAMMHWREHGQSWPVSVNLSGSDLTDPALPGTLAALVGERGFDPGLFTLEVPEGVFARNADMAARTIGEFRRLGFKTALDGGGAVIVPAEFIAPAYFSEIKISGAAIIQFAARLKQAGIGFIGKRVAQAVAQGLKATAVGVEDETTLAALTSLGFTSAQGAHICRAVDAKELVGWSFARNFDRPVALAPVEPEEDVLLLDNPITEEEASFDEDEPQQDISLNYAEMDFAIPGFDGVPVCAAALDPICFFPDRRLVALLRRRPRNGRRLPGVERPIRMRVRKPKPKKKGFLARALGL